MKIGASGRRKDVQGGVSHGLEGYNSERAGPMELRCGKGVKRVPKKGSEEVEEN